MAVGLVVLSCWEYRFVTRRVELRCGWEGEFWIPGEEDICLYHAESWTTDAMRQAAATCVPPPGIGGSLDARGIELGGRLLSYCWCLYMVVDVETDCGTTSQQCQDSFVRFRESTKVFPEKVRRGGGMVGPPRWRLEGRIMSQYKNK